MQLVVAGTGYLVLIGHIDILSVLFERVILPVAVRKELAQSGAPRTVQNWIASPPLWVEVRQGGQSGVHSRSNLDPGEEEAIALAVELWARSRQAGRPTADAAALDIDVLLAAQALRIGGSPVVTTTNPKHLSQFVPAMHWEKINPTIFAR